MLGIIVGWPIHRAEAGDRFSKDDIDCEGGAFQNGIALLLISLPADSDDRTMLEANIWKIADDGK